MGQVSLGEIFSLPAMHLFLSLLGFGEPRLRHDLRKGSGNQLQHGLDISGMRKESQPWSSPAHQEDKALISHAQILPLPSVSSEPPL